MYLIIRLDLNYMSTIVHYYNAAILKLLIISTCAHCYLFDPTE